MSEIVYPRALSHQGVVYNVVVRYHHQRVAQPSEDFFQRPEGQAQMQKIQRLVSELYRIGDHAAEADSLHIGVSHQFLETTRFSYSSRAESSRAVGLDPSRATMHTFGKLPHRLEHPEEQILTPLDRSRESVDREARAIISSTTSHRQSELYNSKHLMKTIARVGLERIFTDRPQELRRPLPPFEIQLVRQPARRRDRSHPRDFRIPSERLSAASEELEQQRRSPISARSAKMPESRRPQRNQQRRARTPDLPGQRRFQRSQAQQAARSFQPLRLGGKSPRVTSDTD